jgi:hypothetical protein
MAFNFGAFVGGFSKQLVADFEAEEERQFEMEKLAETEAMKQRLASASRRRAEQAATEKMMGALSMFYSPEVAAEIAKRGSTAVDFALESAPKALAEGYDPNAMWNLPTTKGDFDNPETQADITDTIGMAKAPKAAITEGSTAADTTIPLTSFGVNAEVFSQIHGKPEKYEATFGAAISLRSQKLITETDPAKRAKLIEERDALIADYAKFNAATKDPKEPKPVFDYGTITSNVNEALKNARNRYGFETDIEGNITNMMEGDEYKAYTSELYASNMLEATYGELNDPAMNNRITAMRDQAERNLIEYGRGVMAEGTTSKRLKGEASSTAFANGIKGGKYRIGDVITYVDSNGIKKYAIYTGLPNAQGLPIVIGR